MQRHIGTILISATCLLGGGATAGIAVPQGCSPVVTIEKGGCVATTVFECDGHFEDHSYVAGRFNEMHRFTKDWALAGYRLGNDLQTLEVLFDQGRSITVAELIETGSASTDRKVVVGTGRITGREYHLQASATLTGEEVMLSGHRFQTGTMRRSFTPPAGSNRLEFEFDILVSSDLNLFIEGAYARQTRGSEPERITQQPMSLRFPGDPGFLAQQLEAGCNG